MVNLLKQGINIEDVKDLPGGEEKFGEMIEYLVYVDLYSNLIAAKEIGVVFHIDDFSPKELRIFSVIHSEINKIQKA